MEEDKGQVMTSCGCGHCERIREEEAWARSSGAATLAHQDEIVKAMAADAVSRMAAKGAVSGYLGMKSTEDPWKHRSDRMKCRTCMWFVRKETRPGADLSEIGRCRRHAPAMGGYPVVMVDDWCGDHRLDESKS